MLVFVLSVMYTGKQQIKNDIWALNLLMATLTHKVVFGVLYYEIEYEKYISSVSENFFFIYLQFGK